MARKPLAENSGGTALSRGRPFKPGQSGNPGGRPKDVHGITALAREHCPAALMRLVQLMDSKNESVARAACAEVLDRGIGRPVQALEHSGEVKTAFGDDRKSQLDFARRVAFAMKQGMHALKELKENDT